MAALMGFSGFGSSKKWSFFVFCKCILSYK
jgi:hypothetical protein